ncbi:MAG: DNA-directed RNA polymerase subunit beta, partial [Candidatus Subteraquimicrobiales bacterium]|nr:DNA-directed RNA polymerase subunit beta [Candidatus Subteraquimicrobiales bacterium]
MISDLNLRKRRSFSKIPEVLEPPNLIAIQTDSFQWLKDKGLVEVFKEASPIKDFTETLILEFGSYRFSDPKYSEAECKEKDLTYSASLNVDVKLINKETGEIKEQSVFFGGFPLMTNKGTFIINGTERVVVSQLVRSPGVYFSQDIDKQTDKIIYSCKVIPNRGAWLEFEIDKRDFIVVRIDRKRKQLATVLFKALGLSKEEISERFNHSELI